MKRIEGRLGAGLRGLTYPAVLLLLAVLAYGTSEMLHAQLLRLGDFFWPEYHQLRVDPTEPECDPETFRKGLAAIDAPSTAPKIEEESELDDLLADDDDAPAPSKGTDEDDALDALLEDDEPPTQPSTNATEDELDDLLADDPPKAAAPVGGADDEDELDALLADTPSANGKVADDEGDSLDALLDDDDDEEVAGKPDPRAQERQAWSKALDKCEAKHVEYASIQSRLDDNVRRFRAVETTVAAVVDLGVSHMSHGLALLLLICAVVTTLRKEHIALRPPKSRMDHLVSDLSQLVASVLLLHSSWAFKAVEEAAVGEPLEAGLSNIWITGFGALAVINMVHVMRAPRDATPGGNVFRGLLSVPLFATMCIISGIYFLVSEGHGSGLAIYIGRLTEHSILYLHVGLYVWVGMLLKRTRLASLAFDVVRPWKLTPELLAFVAVVGAALPTAYSGASGIFVIACGAVIYEELRRAGARRQLALAATAMSGSMGVVLSPCLLVVIVASLNKQVTTDELYGWGTKVFILSAVLFFIVSLINRQGPIKIASPKEGIPGSLAALKPLVPYVLVCVAIWLVYHFGFDVHVDEHSAPFVLPVFLLGVLWLDKKRGRVLVGSTGTEHAFEFRKALGSATGETTGHIGALLMLMGLSVCLGGIIERAELMSLVPETIGSVWTTMGVLVLVLVVIGMTMDPYGAVILVSATIAELAYQNGIDAVHFWMVVLVAFELGYLTPPVALNHLLSRQVVGDDEVEASKDVEGGFWARHEKILLPITVMGTALVIVAFVPLLFMG